MAGRGRGRGGGGWKLLVTEFFFSQKHLHGVLKCKKQIGGGGGVFFPKMFLGF